MVVVVGGGGGGGGGEESSDKHCGATRQKCSTKLQK